MARTANRWQLVLFLGAVLLPSAVLVVVSRRTIQQNRELAGKRSLDDRRTERARLARDLLARAEQLRAAALASTGNLAPAVAMIASVEGGRLVFQLKGRVTSVEVDALMLDVRKTSNKRAYPKGRAVVPRPEVTQFTLARKEGHTWSAVGASVGGSIGAGAAAGLVQVLEGDGRRALAAAPAVGIPAALGFGLGWAADHEYVTVIVAPDGSAAVPARQSGK